MVIKMENQSYYRTFNNDDGNENITDRALVVNCAGICVMDKPFTSHVRAGRRDFYLLYLQSGELDALANGECCVITAGSFVVFYPNREYKYTKTSADDVVYYWAHFTGGCACGLVESLGLNGGVKIVDGGDAGGGFIDLFSEFIRRDSQFEISAAAKLVSICVFFSRHIRGAARREPSVRDRISASLLHIHKNFNTDIPLSALASIEHLSESRYRTLFCRAMGCPPRSYIMSLRIQKARELLSQTPMSVKEVGASVGYCDSLYFCRVFRNVAGLSPREYRRRRG